MKKKDNTELVPKTPKSGKTLKAQLFSAVAMMLVATIALGSSTYAWFINNQTVKVETMDLTVSTSTSLQIAVKQKGAATYTPYKNLITKLDITDTTANNGGAWTAMFNKSLVPASTVDDSLKTTTPAFFMSDNHIGAKSQKLDSFVSVSDLGEGEVKRIPLSFLSSNDLNVYFGQTGTANLADLVTAQHVKSQAEIDAIGDATAKSAAQAVFDAEKAQAEAVKAVLHVSIVPHTTTLITGNIAPLTFQFDKGANAFTSGTGNNTDYSYITSYTQVADEVTGKFDGISAVTANTPSKDDSATKISAITGAALQQAKGPGMGTANAETDANAYIAKVGVGTDNVPTVTAGKFPLFTLKAKEARDVDVLIWLEGTDKDCISALSSYKFNLDLPFAAAPTV